MNGKDNVPVVLRIKCSYDPNVLKVRSCGLSARPFNGSGQVIQ